MASADRKVTIYQGKEGELMKDETNIFENKEWSHQGGVTGCEFFYDFETGKKELFVTSSTDKTIKIWDLEKKIMLKELQIKTKKDSTIGDQ